MDGETKLYRKHYKDNREWSDRLLRRVAGILGEVFIQTSPDVEDMQHNTDLMVLNNRPHRYAVRIRKNRYSKWADQFTIRSGLRSDIPTEFDKIIDGFGDYMFYGIANSERDDLVCYSIIDLDVFRNHLGDSTVHAQVMENQDETKFLFFSYDQFPEELIVRSHHED